MPKVDAAAEETAGAATSTATAAVLSGTKRERSPRARRLGGIAVFAAAALVLQLAAAFWPQKQTPPGIAYGNGLITPAGVWSIEEEGLYAPGSTADGSYVLLRELTRRSYREGTARVKYRDWSESRFGDQADWQYSEDGGYYLFNGLVLETLDWKDAWLAAEDAAFYTQERDGGTVLCRRELETGKVHQIERWEEEGRMVAQVSRDGSTVVYCWHGDEEDSGSPDSFYRWRAGDKEPQIMDVPDNAVLWDIGADGRTCLFWREDWDGNESGNESGSGDWNWGWDPYGILRTVSNYILWRDGESLLVPSGMTLMWNNANYTELIFQGSAQSGGYNGGWYYWNVGAAAEPVRMGFLEDSYLSVAEQVSGSYVFPALAGRFWRDYTDGKFYYLTAQGALQEVPEAAGADTFLTNEAGSEAVYLKNGDLYRIAVRPGEGIETRRLTDTARVDENAYASMGTVTGFALSEDLAHLYYVDKTGVHHWKEGESVPVSPPDFVNYGSTSMAVTREGGCYFAHGGNVYYTQDDQRAEILLEDIGNGAMVQLVGRKQWPMALSSVWVNGETSFRYWRLNGYDAPVELAEWVPKEGKV